jgi:hypothetical protein
MVGLDLYLDLWHVYGRTYPLDKVRLHMQMSYYRVWKYFGLGNIWHLAGSGFNDRVAGCPDTDNLHTSCLHTNAASL